MSKKRNLFACLICFLFAFVCLVSCVGVTLSPELAAKQQAETDAQEVLSKLVWDDEDRTAIVSSLIFTTQNKNYPGVTISWSSSEEDIIDTNGKVNRPDSDDPRNVLVGEDLLATVVITATVVAEYSWEDNGTQSASTEPITKQFTFTVLAKPEGTDTGTIEDVKLRAWNYIYVEQGVDKALVSNSSITYNVLLSGVVTAKLNADGATKGFMLHDGTDGIYVYGDNSKINVGDSVEVIGGVYSYYGSLQVGSSVSVSKSNVKVTLPEYKEVTPQAWEDQNKGLGDEVIGHLGGDLYKVEGYLTASYNATTKDEFCITDANTGETSWIYYKSYNAEMKAELEKYVGKYVKVTGLGYDRDSRIVKNHLLWDGGIEEATAPVVDDQTKANVALSQITLQASYTEDFDLNQNGVWEIVSGTGVEIVEGVAKVTRGEEDQVVVLKVTVTVGEATASKELTVTIKKVVQQQPTIEYITISEAIALGSAQEHNTYTEEKYYVKGTVTGFYNTTYGNFYLTDGNNQICVYGLYSADGSTRYDKLEVKPVDGDEIIVYGVLGQYNGSPQFKNAWFVEFVEDEPVEEDPYGCISIEEAIALGSAQEHNTYTADKYYVKGTVTGLYNTTYGNFYVTDGTNQICVYGLYSEDGSTRYDKMEVKPVDGDVVVVYGVLGQYNGTPQFKNAWLIQLGEGSEQPHEHKYVNGVCSCGEKDPNYVEPEVKTISISEAIALGSAQAHNTYTTEKYYVEGTVTGFYNTQYGNFYLTDGTNQICIYGLYSADGKVRYDAMEVKPVDGDKVKVLGVIGQYNGTPQFKNAWLIEHDASAHEHEFVDGVCSCGEKDPNYVAPETPSNVVIFDFSAGDTSMASSYNAEAAEMTYNGVTFGYLQMKANTYNGSSYLMFCKSTDAHLYNKTAFASAIVKVEVTIPSGASASAAYFLSLHKEAAAGNITSSTTVKGNNTSFAIEATAEDGFYYFNLSSDSTTGKNGQVLKIVVTLADGNVVTPEPPVHEHEFVEGKCECGEVDPDYVAPEQPVAGTTVTLNANVTANYNASAEGEDVTSCTSLAGSDIFTLTVGAPTAAYKNQVYFATSGQIRLYSDASGVGNTLTIKSTKKIVSIAITYEAANRSGATFTIDGTTLAGATDVTEETIDVNGYSITIANNKTSGQVRLVSVVITYEA